DRNSAGLQAYFDMENYVNASTSTHRVFDVDGQAPILTAARAGGGPYDVATVYPFPGHGPTYHFVAGNSPVNIGAAMAPSSNGYVWDTGDNTQAISVNSGGVYVRTSFWGGCTFQDTFEVAILAVTLADFQAVPEEQAVSLTWETATESNNLAFVIQRSADGVAFEDLNEIPGAGNSQVLLHYGFTDHQPHAGQNWYRLKMVDYDGGIEYSDIRLVNLDQNGTLSATIYPNPAQDRLWIDFGGRNIDHASAELYDLAGQRVTGINMGQLIGAPMTMTLSGVAPGVYLLKVTADGQKLTRKVMIKN
ncbi:MAG: T9SS type A sorting domain-containing protein, partial [Bacteroidota bacterium]